MCENTDPTLRPLYNIHVENIHPKRECKMLKTVPLSQVTGLRAPLKGIVFRFATHKNILKHEHGRKKTRSPHYDASAKTTDDAKAFVFPNARVFFFYKIFFSSNSRPIKHVTGIAKQHPICVVIRITFLFSSF